MYSVFEWFVLILQCDTYVIFVLSDEPRQNQGRGLVDANLLKLFGCLVIVVVVCCYSLVFLSYINIEIGKKMLNVRLAGDHQYGKLLFTWLSLVMSLMVSFSTVFFPRGVLD